MICPWATSTPDYLAYHDEEWGRPVTDERGLFERMTLEAFQSGLSWLTILRKRDAFREVFHDFDFDAVARFKDEDVERLLQDARIVRNRAKVEATVANARALVALHDDGDTLAALVWSARPETDPPAPGQLGEVPAFTDASKALAKDLKKRGFRFLGPTTVYAGMQACGVVNDHLATCPARAACQRERESVRVEAVEPERLGWWCVTFGHDLPGWETSECSCTVAARRAEDAVEIAREAAVWMMNDAATHDGEPAIATPDRFVFLHAERMP
jgi:DNA-3-methyladenine glycosylase I